MHRRQWLITGSRFGRPDFECEMACFLELEGPPEIVIAGTTDEEDFGVDGQALRWCRANNLPFRGFDADWDDFGDAAGPLRNQAMVNLLVPQIATCLAFPARHYSPGTLGCARMAHRAGILTYVVDLDAPYVLYPGQRERPLLRAVANRRQLSTAGASPLSPFGASGAELAWMLPS